MSLIQRFYWGCWTSLAKKSSFHISKWWTQSPELAMLRGQERRPKCVVFTGRVSIDGLPPSTATTAFMWCVHRLRPDFIPTALPFLILNHLPLAEGPAISEMFCFFWNGFLDLPQKDFQNIPFPFFLPPLSLLSKQVITPFRFYCCP